MILDLKVDDQSGGGPGLRPGEVLTNELTRSAQLVAAPNCPVTQRKRGAYYTATNIADFMAEWAIRDASDVVLEPSFGGGAFLSAARDTSIRKFQEQVKLVGAELSRSEADVAKGRWFGPKDVLYTGDFFLMPKHEVNAVIGNPPFVRLRNLSSSAASRAMAACDGHLPSRMASSGSIWMPFVVASSRFLVGGGRMAFVLPFELTYVKYARPLWQYLAENFGSLRLMRSRQRLFPDILQDVVLLFADGFGGRTETVEYSYSDTGPAMLRGEVAREAISVAAVVSGSREFQAVHAGTIARQGIDRISAQLIRVESACRFNIGYVCGDKKYFHPSAEEVRKWKIQDDSLVPTIASGRRLSRAGLFTSSIDINAERLFKPGLIPNRVDAKYIKQGQRLGVDDRYKCRVRTPWHDVPDVRTPDLVLSVFSERPLLMVNDAKFAVSNSLLAGFIVKPEHINAFVAAWYTSLTLLSCETEIHALGGGLMILIPGEVGRIRIPVCVKADKGHLRELDDTLRSGDVEGAYRVGDEYVLARQLGLTPREISAVKNSVREMASWRNRALDNAVAEKGL